MVLKTEMWLSFQSINTDFINMHQIIMYIILILSDKSDGLDIQIKYGKKILKHKVDVKVNNYFCF